MDVDRHPMSRFRQVSRGEEKVPPGKSARLLRVANHPNQYPLTRTIRLKSRPPNPLFMI